MNFAGAMERLERALRDVVHGEVRFDSFSRVLYSTDASIYQIMPVGVVIPRDEEDIVAALRIAAEERVPVLPRGGGTSLAGQSIGPAIILDCSKYMDRLLELNPAGPWARVQPGVVQDELNIEARQYDLRLGPDTATSNRATLGGMTGNNSAGARSIVYGKMVDHTLEIRTLCMDGTELRLQPLSGDDAKKKLSSTGREGEIYRTVSSVVDANRGEIDRRFPKILRRVSGYNLDALLADPTDLRKLIVGSEGTLGIVTEMKVRLVPRPHHSVLNVVHFADLFEALEATQIILQFNPSAVELIDRMVLEMTRAQLEHARRMTFVQGDPDALLLVEFSGQDRDELQSRLAAMEAALRSAGKGYAFTQAHSPADQENIWRVRRAGQGLLQGMKGDSKPITFVEDTAVAPDRLAPYMRKFKALLDHHGVRAAFYAHASVGCIHVRPLINLKDRRDIEKMKVIAPAVGELVIEFGGAMSGEHGDGLVRSWFVERFFGPQIYRAFTEVKRAFDPFGLMNPGKIVNGPPIDSSLRYGSAYQTIPVRTHFDWSKDGGFARSVELCSGLGACRKKTDGTMCPSYMVTREEEHSTRGRANLLRAVLSGQLPPEELTGRRLYEALDLCLECKGCKAECPASVDMAKLKYEFLAHYHEVHGIPLGTRLFGNFRSLARWGSATAPLSNWAARSAPMRWVLDRATGIDARRRLPPFAKPNFLQWWHKHANGQARKRASPTRGRVALFPDTFMIYNYPEIGKAAVELLERLGYDVILAEAGCCGRTMISKGMIGAAKKAARRNVEALLPLAEQGIPIVGCEPSCILTFRDETPDLVAGKEAQTVAKHALLIDEFLAAEHERAPLQLRGQASGSTVLFHGHCHQKAIAGTASARNVLSAAGFNVEEVDSGCCGMAGSFGFEKEHYDVSMAVGERRLLPAVRSKPASVPVVAMGVSCRQQIAHGTGRKALHL
ncbi:MAG TPA: FAD-linked oxidase C-terminal domain-containing protein, partial [bacterium]|nr:FAD-linked oxidase C-terminal domain-containing protein [bacterium]